MSVPKFCGRASPSARVDVPRRRRPCRCRCGSRPRVPVAASSAAARSPHAVASADVVVPSWLPFHARRPTGGVASLSRRRRLRGTGSWKHVIKRAREPLARGLGHASTPPGRQRSDRRSCRGPAVDHEDSKPRPAGWRVGGIVRRGGVHAIPKRPGSRAIPATFRASTHHQLGSAAPSAWHTEGLPYAATNSQTEPSRPCGSGVRLYRA